MLSHGTQPYRNLHIISYPEVTGVSAFWGLLEDSRCGHDWLNHKLLLINLTFWPSLSQQVGLRLKVSNCALIFLVTTQIPP